MKRSQGIAAILLLHATALSAQTPRTVGTASGPPPAVTVAQSGVSTRRPLARGDASVFIGLYTVNKHQLEDRNRWDGDSLFGGAGAGWYWTDHAKTEVQFGANSDVSFYTATPTVVAGHPVFIPSRYTFSTQRASLTQVYQFGRNAWFHPYVGGGLDIVWEKTARDDEHAYAFDPVTRQSRLVRERFAHPTQVDVQPRAAASAGFKGYVSRRGFFVVDGRATFGRRLDEVIIRVGVGADF